MAWYCTEVFDRRIWQRDEAEKKLREESLARLRDPALRDDLWRRWAKHHFYTAVVFPIFDIGQLALYPDREAEKSWKNIYGKHGLLQHFTPGSRSESWQGFWESVEDVSSEYLCRVDGNFRQFIEENPPERSAVVEDALEYGWLGGFLQDYRRSLTQSMWEAGVVEAENPSQLSLDCERAETRMLMEVACRNRSTT